MTLSGCLSSSSPSSLSTSGTTMTTYTGGSYALYDEKLLPTLSGDIVLFFHADRCSTCIAAEQSFKASGIPAGLHILQVDFDTAKELRKKYTVLTQTSFVHVRADGTMVSRWIGARDIRDVMDKIAEDVTIATTASAVVTTGTVTTAAAVITTAAVVTTTKNLKSPTLLVDVSGVWKVHLNP